MNDQFWPLLHNGDVINHGRRIPVGIHVVVRLLEWPHVRPSFVQKTIDVPRIGSQSGIEFGNGDVSDLELLPSLFLICLEYFIERLLSGFSSARFPGHVGNPQVGRYLVVPGDGERTVLQLFGGKVGQNVGNISRNI